MIGGRVNCLTTAPVRSMANALARDAPPDVPARTMAASLRGAPGNISSVAARDCFAESDLSFFAITLLSICFLVFVLLPLESPAGLVFFVKPIFVHLHAKPR